MKELTEEILTIAPQKEESKIAKTSSVGVFSDEVLKPLLDKENFEKKKSILQEIDNSEIEGLRNLESPKKIAGRLFEILCEKEFPPQSKLADELLDLMQHPKKYGLEGQFKYYNNPDIAYIEIDEVGNISVKSIGEAKAGKLDYRAFDQLSKGGSGNTVKKQLRFWTGIQRLFLRRWVLVR